MILVLEVEKIFHLLEIVDSYYIYNNNGSSSEIQILS